MWGLVLRRGRASPVSRRGAPGSNLIGHHRQFVAYTTQESASLTQRLTKRGLKSFRNALK
jgi:hypothetical protein